MIPLQLFTPFTCKDSQVGSLSIFFFFFFSKAQGKKKKLFLLSSKQKLADKVPEKVIVSVLGKRLAPPRSACVLLVVPRLLGLDEDQSEVVQRQLFHVRSSHKILKGFFRGKVEPAGRRIVQMTTAKIEAIYANRGRTEVFQFPVRCKRSAAPQAEVGSTLGAFH